MSKHYVCTGSCKGEAEMPTVCKTEGCEKKDKPLMECKCEDSVHDHKDRQCEYCGEYCMEKGGCALSPFKEELE